MIIPLIINIACIIGWSVSFIQFARSKYKPSNFTIGCLMLIAIFAYLSFALNNNPFGGIDP